MIHILYLSHCGSNIGGGEKQLFYLVTNLDRNTYTPYVICPDDGIFVEKLKNANIHTTVLKLPQWRKAKSFFTRSSSTKRLIDFVQEHNIQLIHTSDSWLNPYLCQVKKQIHLPIISHVRNILTSAQIVKFNFDQMDLIIAISDQSKATLVNNGIDQNRIEVVLNCVDLSEFRPKSKVNKSDAFIVGLVGRIEPFKRQIEFVEIASMVYRQCQNVRFHIIGAALDTPKHKAYEQEVTELVPKLQLQNVIQFTGHQDNMQNVFNKIDLLVTLSAGSVIGEAMASGLPVIGTPIGSTSDMIVNGVTGWIIPSDSLDSIASKIVQLVSDCQLQKKMGIAARLHAEENLGINLHIQKTHEIYEKLLNSS